MQIGLVYCMDYIDHNFDWLEEKLAELQGVMMYPLTRMG